MITAFVRRQSKVFEQMEQLTFSSLVGALSYALDMTEGAQPGYALRACLLGMRIGDNSASIDSNLVISTLSCCSRMLVAVPTPHVCIRSSAATRSAQWHSPKSTTGLGLTFDRSSSPSRRSIQTSRCPRDQSDALHVQEQQ